MVTFPPIAKNENGFVLVAALLTLILLVIVGISATTTTTVEVQIAGNEKAYNMAFYQADGSGGELAAELLEQNIACPTGFHNQVIGNATNNQFNAILATKNGASIWDFASNVRQWDTTNKKVFQPLTLTTVERLVLEAAGRWSEIPDLFLPSTVDPANPAATVPRTMISVGGDSHFAAGAAIQMAAGYERLGKSAGAGGVIMEFDITTRRIGQGNSEATVHQQWRHVTGQEGACNY